MTPFGEDRFPPSDNQFVKVMPLVEYQALLSRIAELEDKLREYIECPEEVGCGKCNSARDLLKLKENENESYPN